MGAALVLLYDFFALLVSLPRLPLRWLRRGRQRHLVVELTGDPPWRAGGRGLSPWSRGRHRPGAVRSLKQLAERLDWAARDPAIRGVVVKVEGFDGPSAKLHHVRRLLEALRDLGKEILFYGRAVDMREYALMACGNRIWLAPGGRLDLRGYCAELSVWGRTLGRIGVRAHFIRRGVHKTAPETFTDSEVSQAQKDAVGAVLGELYDATVSTISHGRRLPEAAVRRLVDEGPYTATRALERGLIDGIGDEEDLEALLAVPPEKKARLEPLPRYRGPFLIPGGRLKPFPRPRVGVVRLDGIIKLGRSVQLPLLPHAAGCDSVIDALRRAREDRSVRAVVLAIDSRGGSVLASELVSKAVRRLARVKPVVAYFDRVAASGGYQAALGATAILGSEGSITGSIGVFGGKVEISGLLDLLGTGRAVIRFGRNSAIGSVCEPFQDTERAALEREVDESYRGFLALVAQARNMGVDRVAGFAQGRIYTGRSAKMLGLIDENGSFEDAVRKAAQLASIDGEPQVVPLGPARRTLRSLADPSTLRAAVGLLLPAPAERLLALADPFRIDPPI